MTSGIQKVNALSIFSAELNLAHKALCFSQGGKPVLLTQEQFLILWEIKVWGYLLLSSVPFAWVTSGEGSIISWQQGHLVDALLPASLVSYEV